MSKQKKQIDLYLSDLSFKIDKLRQYFSVHGLCIYGDIREIHSITSELLEENNIIIKNNADYKTFKKMEALDLVKHIKSNSKDVTEINNILSDLSFKIDKLKQDFALNNAFNKQDITEIKILINTIEGAE